MSDTDRFHAVADASIGNVRKNQEDASRIASIANENGVYHLWIVADGMGGGLRGEDASERAVEAVVEYFKTRPWHNQRETLREAFLFANAQVYEMGTGGGQATRSAMGTTLVAVLFEERTARYWVANVGDSRAYLIRGGAANQITRDHSLVQERVDAGLLAQSDMSRAAGRNVVTRAIGIEADVEPDIILCDHPLEGGELLLLCTDGLHGMVNDTTIAGLAVKTNPPGLLPGALVKAATRPGKGKDNVTVLVAGEFDPRVADLGPVGDTVLDPTLAGVRGRARRSSPPPKWIGVLGVGALALVGISAVALALTDQDPTPPLPSKSATAIVASSSPPKGPKGTVVATATPRRASKLPVTAAGCTKMLEDAYPNLAVALRADLKYHLFAAINAMSIRLGAQTNNVCPASDDGVAPPLKETVFGPSIECVTEVARLAFSSDPNIAHAQRVAGLNELDRCASDEAKP